MREQMKKIANSEKSMKIVNLLFFLSVLFPNRGYMFLFYLAWIAVLVCFIRNTTSKSVKIFNGVLIAVAVFMLGLNFYFMLDGFL